MFRRSWRRDLFGVRRFMRQLGVERIADDDEFIEPTNHAAIGRRNRKILTLSTTNLGEPKAKLAGYLRKKSVELVQCETSDLEVPANDDFSHSCEICIQILVVGCHYKVERTHAYAGTQSARPRNSRRLRSSSTLAVVAGDHLHPRHSHRPPPSSTPG